MLRIRYAAWQPLNANTYVLKERAVMSERRVPAYPGFRSWTPLSPSVPTVRTALPPPRGGVPGPETNAAAAVGVAETPASTWIVHPAIEVGDTTIIPAGGNADATIGDSAITASRAITAHAGVPRRRERPPPRIQAVLSFRSTASDTRRAIRVSKTIEVPSTLSVPHRSSPRGAWGPVSGPDPPTPGTAGRILTCRFQRR